MNPNPAWPPMSDGIPAYMKIPGLGALLLNAGAISALTAIWTELEGEQGAEYQEALNGAFIAFALGIGLAVISLCCQFVYDALAAAGADRTRSSLRKAYSVKETGGRRIWGLLRQGKLPWPVVVLAAGALIVLAGSIAFPWTDEGPTLGNARRLTWGFAVLVAAILLIGIAIERDRLCRLLDWGKYGASGLGILMFGLGLLITMIAWTSFQVGKEDNESPLSRDGQRSRSGDVTYNVGCGGRTGVACPPAPAPAPITTQPPAQVGGTNVHIDVNLGPRGGPNICPHRPPCRRCPLCPPPES